MSRKDGAAYEHLPTITNLYLTRRERVFRSEETLRVRKPQLMVFAGWARIGLLRFGCLQNNAA
jgi:hypothetical protein